jgi:tetratricopeptide (TPR) repeat protein
MFELGQKLVNKGRQEIAREVFGQVLEINPDFAEAYYQLGMDFFYGLSENERARNMLEKYLEIGENQDHISNTKNVLLVIEKSVQ